MLTTGQMDWWIYRKTLDVQSTLGAIANFAFEISKRPLKKMFLVEFGADWCGLVDGEGR